MRRLEMNQQTEISRAATKRATLFEGLSFLLDSPERVLNHSRMSLDEKRAVLASWASDACAVENQPTLRKLDNGTIIPLEEILCGLRALDQDGGRGKRPLHRVMPSHTAFDRRSALISGWRRKWRFTGKDDEDDPPPCPASVAPRWPRGGQSGPCVAADREPIYA